MLAPPCDPPADKLIATAPRASDAKEFCINVLLDEIACSIFNPIILDETYRAGEIKVNDIIVFAAVGSGWTWGAGVLKWS